MANNGKTSRMIEVETATGCEIDDVLEPRVNAAGNIAAAWRKLIAETELDFDYHAMYEMCQIRLVERPRRWVRRSNYNPEAD